MSILKIGDCVVMNDKYRVSEKNKKRLFEVRSEPQDICGTSCVWLHGYTGAYAVDGLTKVDRAQEVKARVVWTLEQVEREKLPVFIQAMKQQSFLKVVLGEIKKEDCDVIYAAADEYLEASKGGAV